MNALEDKDITAALYRASQAGVPGGFDHSRYLPIATRYRGVVRAGAGGEHRRSVSGAHPDLPFPEWGSEEYFIGSADCMKRNLESRVEVVTPVELPELQRELQQILDIQLNDRRDAWDMQSDGTYIQRMPGEGDDPRGSQQILIELAERRQRRLGA